MSIEFLVDDVESVKRFLEEVPLRMRRLRFDDKALIADSPSQWMPTHTVVVSKDGNLLALADCIITPDGKVGNYSLLAKEKCGSYAIKAVLCLKRLFPVSHVETTFANPTDDLLTLTRRWADTIYDQETWANARELTSLHNTGAMLAPIPIAITMSNLKLFSLPPVRHLDKDSQLQITSTCLSKNCRLISSVDEKAIPRNLVIALSFEVMNLPLRKRQNLTRAFLVRAASEIGLLIIDRAQEKFFSRNAEYYVKELMKFTNGEAPPQFGSVFQLINN